MKDLIEALTILSKYGNPDFPTHCEHDVLTVLIDPADVSAEDLVRLKELHFYPGDDWASGMFQSSWFGSA